MDNPLWYDKDFLIGHFHLTTSINPIKECLKDIEAYLNEGMFPNKEISIFKVNTPVEAILSKDSVGRYYLINRVQTIAHLLNSLETMYISNDVRFQRDMADYYGDKSC
jgi:hypothetical protein